MFRQFLDTSFTDYRQVRIVVQELPDNSIKEPSSDFQKFCKTIFDHKSFKYENFKLEYCYLKQSLAITEAPFNEIQLYRRPFGFIFYTVCHTTTELRIVFEEYAKIKQREKDVYKHLFVHYRPIHNDDETDEDDDDESSFDDKLSSVAYDDSISTYVPSYRPSISSMSSERTDRSFSQISSQPPINDLLSNDDNISGTFDSASLTRSSSGNPEFQALRGDTIEEDDQETTGSVSIVLPITPDQPKKFRHPLFRNRTIGGTLSRFNTFDSDLSRVLSCLEADIKKSPLQAKEFDITASAIHSQLADIRLMVYDEKDCSLLKTQPKNRKDSVNDKTVKLILEDFDKHVMQIVLNQYKKANSIVNLEAAKQKLPKKLIEARTVKRQGDCCLLLGAIEKAYEDYQRAADLLKSLNDNLWLAAALEARVAADYLSKHKPKRRIDRTLSFLRQISLTKKPSVEKLLNRSNSALSLQPKIETAIQIYNSSNRSLFNKMEFQLELDACLRWCSLLWEQNDIIKYRSDIDHYIDQINILGSYLEEHIDSVYLNAYLAETYDFIGLKRKSALYYRSAAFSGLILLNEQGYHEEINFFDGLIQQARKGYGIDDNRVIFPLIQKTILNESIQISLKRNDFATIIENVHFAIESLIEHMTDAELEALLTFLNVSDQTIPCSYCSIPRLKSLDIMPLPNRLKAFKSESKNNIFIYHAKRAIPSQQKSLHRKVEFYWVKNEPAQIALLVENYLPATMTIDKLEFITDNQLITKLDQKYRIPARTTQRLLYDCTPNEVGPLRIQGLRYHIWSTNQKFRFEDFPVIRQCACSVDVVDELPIIDVKYLLVNNTEVTLSNKSTVYNAQVHRGEDLFVTLGLINSSTQCAVDHLEIQVYTFGLNMTDYVKVSQFNLPMSIGNMISPKIELTEVYNRYLARQDRSTSNIECLKVEFRLNYSNELSNTNGYHRQTKIEVHLDYFSSVTFEIDDIQNDDEDSSYLMCCTIDNHLLEAILCQNNIIKPSESSLVLLKQDKIKLDAFPSDLNQLITIIRTQLPTQIQYKTADTNKQLHLPIEWQHFSNDKIQNHLNDLILSPFTCYWHFERIANTLQIHLCVTSKYYKLSKLEFIFPSSIGVRFLNSHKIIFNNMEPGNYFNAERTLIYSQDNNSDVLVVDVYINNITWKRITETF